MSPNASSLRLREKPESEFTLCGLKNRVTNAYRLKNHSAANYSQQSGRNILTLDAPSEIDYGFFSPTPIYWLEGGKLTLRYRVVVHAGDTKTADIKGIFKQYERPVRRSKTQKNVSGPPAFLRKQEGG